MKKLLMSVGMVGAMLAGGAAVASEPVMLTDGQMDGVTAGRIAFGLGFTGLTESFTTRSGSGFTAQGSRTNTQDGGLIVANGGLFIGSSLSSNTISEAETGFTTNLTLLPNEGLGFSTGTFAISGSFNPG